VTKKTALLSVSDKSGLLPFAKALADMDWRILSTGGTLKGVELQYQQPFTFLPEALKGFGFIGNFTYVDSNVNYGTEAAPKNGAANSAAPMRVITKSQRQNSASTGPKPKVRFIRGPSARSRRRCPA